MGNLSLPPLLALRRGGRIGLLGGSFNPAHLGHRHISLMALKMLNLQEIWWLVSPQNPLKSAADMAPLKDRLDHAVRVADHPRIKVTALESLLGSRFTADSLTALHRRFPVTRFVWLMGADNLAQIHRWAHWNRIFKRTAVAVLDRPAYSAHSLASPAAHRYRRQRYMAATARQLVSAPTPAWTFLPIRLVPLSATQLRANGFGLTQAAQPLLRHA